MKAYLLTTGIVFVLVVVAHAARICVEGVHVVADPFFASSTLLSIGLAIWAGRLWRVLSRRDEQR